MMTLWVPGLLALAAAVCLVHSVRQLTRLFRDPGHDDSAFWLIRGGRALIVAVALAAIAGGLRFEAPALRLFGVVFLIEELYETGMVLALLRFARSRN